MFYADIFRFNNNNNNNNNKNKNIKTTFFQEHQLKVKQSLVNRDQLQRLSADDKRRQHMKQSY